MKADEKTMRERALAWVTMRNGHQVTRAEAVGEDHMALDVLDLLAEVARMRPVYEAAKAWKRSEDHEAYAMLKQIAYVPTWKALDNLRAVIDAALASEHSPKEATDGSGRDRVKGAGR